MLEHRAARNPDLQKVSGNQRLLRPLIVRPCLEKVVFQPGLNIFLEKGLSSKG